MGNTGGTGEVLEGCLGEAEGGSGGELRGFGRGSSLPSPGKNISNQGRSIRIPDGVELNIVFLLPHGTDLQGKSSILSLAGCVTMKSQEPS